MTVLKPAAADRIVRRDLLSILRPTDEVRTGMFIQLHGVSLGTRAYGTEFDGLCQQDTLVLKYAPTSIRPDPRDEPLRPFGIEASTAFHATRLPTRRPEDARMQGEVWVDSCDRLTDDKDVFWFNAKDAEEAARATNILKAATDQIAAGSLKTISCETFDQDKRSCEQIIAEQATLDKIDDIYSCAADAGMKCYVIDVASSIRLTIVARLAADSLVPSAVQSIKIEEYIIVT